MADYKARSHTRYEFTAYIDVSNDDDELVLFNRIENLSLGGISFASPTAMEPGGRIEVAINFPDTDETVEVMGEVAWSRPGNPCTVGLKFIDLAGQKREIVRKYLERIRGRQERSAE